MDVQNGGSDSSFKMYSMNVSTGAGHTNDYGNGGNIKVKTDQTGEIRIRIASGYTANNLIFKPKIEKGKVATPWSPYGQGCVKVTKYNKNIFKETYNRKDLTSAYFSIVKGEGFLEKDKTYVISFDTTNNGGIVYLGEYSFQHINTYTVKCDGTRKFFTAKAKEFGHVTDITVLKTRAVTTNAYNISNVMINEYENDTDIDYVQHEEQSYIMPIQQEMLVNDYLDYDNEEEVHMWKKLILTGNEVFTKGYDKERVSGFYTSIDELKNIDKKRNDTLSDFLCNCLIEKKFYTNNISDEVWGNVNTFAFSTANQHILALNIENISTVDELKAYLKTQYDAGIPVTIYYKQETPTRLAFTDEQKVVAKELNNARTYKNVTNITTDSKAILSLDYAKDLETLLTSKESEV